MAASTEATSNPTTMYGIGWKKKDHRRKPQESAPWRTKKVPALFSE
jgi:hypothetical protein